MSSLLPNGKQHFDDNNGRPLVGGRVYYYIPNTSTPKDTWQDEAMTTLNTNPIVLDARGECTAWGYGSYRQVVRDFFGNLIWDRLVTDFTQKIDAAIAELTDDLGQPTGSDMIGFLQSGTGAVARTAQDKMREGLTAADYGAAGDGADQTAELQALITEGATRSGVATIGDGIFAVSASLPLIPDGTLAGAGPKSTMLSRLGSGNLINSPLQDDATIRGITLNMRRSITGSDGHGLAATGQGIWADAMVVQDFGSATGSGGGTGILFEGGAVHRLTNSSFYGDPTAGVSFGWIFGDTITSFASGIYSKNIVGYAHELKNDAVFNNLAQLTAELSNWALAFGQDTPGVDGADFNVTVGLVGKACDAGVIVGEGSYNAFYGAVIDTTGSPGREADTALVRFSGSAVGNSAFDYVGHGSFTQTVYFSGNRNYARVLAHDTTTTVARIAAGSRQNAIEIAHPGLRTSILSSIDDSSGQALDSGTANPVWCHATGQRIGSLSGTFHDRLGVSGALISGNHRWRHEHTQYAITALATPGNTGDIVGWSYAIPGQASQGKMFYAKGATSADDQLVFGIGAADSYSYTQAYFRPETDNNKSLGTSGRRWSVVYAGTGTINTSDAREKTEVKPLSAAEIAAAQDLAREIGWYKWLAMISEKGDAARRHVGMTVQRAIEIMESHGVDPMAWGFICYDSWPEQSPVIDSEGNVLVSGWPAGDRYSFRMDELLAFILKGVVAAQDNIIERLAALEARL